MTAYSDGSGQPLEDPVSNVLKWILLAVAVGSFALFAWATVLTYELAAPQPDRFMSQFRLPIRTAASAQTLPSSEPSANDRFRAVSGSSLARSRASAERRFR
jgi:hypothetical protein